jgi:uncharacterized membrane protein YphA (DoxX/SURF4 family)
MTFVLPMIRIVLAVVFTVSGLAKIFDPPGTRQSLREFGTPKFLVNTGAVFLPVVELLVAVSLTATRTTPIAAATALVLLAGFTVATGYHLTRGRAPRCNCFGTMSGHAVGWPSVVRNLVLIAMAAAVLVLPGTRSGVDTAGWLAATTTVERLSLGISAVILALLLLLLRQQRRTLTLVERLQTRSRPSGGHARTPRTAPPFRLPDLDGNPTSLDDLLAGGRRVLLLFVDPHCGPCDAVLTEASAHRDAVAVISRGSVADNREKAAAHGLRPVLLQHDREVAEAYDVHGTPCVVAVEPDRRITGLPACGQQAIMGLLARVAPDIGPLDRTAVARPAAGN